MMKMGSRRRWGFSLALVAVQVAILYTTIQGEGRPPSSADSGSLRIFSQVPQESGGGKDITTGQRLRKIVSDLVAGLQTSLPESTSRRVAVMPLTSVRGEQSDLGLYVTEKITSELSATQGRFDVVERRKIKDALTEMKLGQTGLLNEASIQSAGKALGADVVVVGTITDLGTEVDIDLRVMEVSTLHVLGRASELLPKDKVVESLLGGQTASGPPGGDAAKGDGGGGTTQKHVFFDDFKVSRLDRYKIACVQGSKGRANLNSEMGFLEVVTGDNTALEIWLNLEWKIRTGRVDVEFLTTKCYPYSGSLSLTVLTESRNGFSFLYPASYYKSHVAKVVSGQDLILASRAGDTYTLNQLHRISLEFDQSSITGKFDGKVVHAVPNDLGLPIATVKIRLNQMDGYIKSIRAEGQ